jgi:hypothetical protein
MSAKDIVEEEDALPTNSTAAPKEEFTKSSLSALKDIIKSSSKVNQMVGIDNNQSKRPQGRTLNNNMNQRTNRQQNLFQSAQIKEEPLLRSSTPIQPLKKTTTETVRIQRNDNDLEDDASQLYEMLDEDDDWFMKVIRLINR